MIGYRGTFLLILAGLDTIFGLALLNGYHPSYLAGSFLLGLPDSTWGVIWVASGVALISGAPATMDRWHFAWAVLLKAAWTTGIVVFAAQPGNPPGEWGAASIWLALAAIIVLVARWPEPPR